jgi:hypothetical protein
MKRTIALLSGLSIVLGAGIVHGIWTQRWARSADLAAAVARLAELPETIDGWEAAPDEEDHESLVAAGAEGWWLRRFTHRRTGAVVHVLILCGPSGRMCVHRPENCYLGAGYELSIPPEQFRVLDGSRPEAAFWTARFRKPEVGGAINLRIFWSWFGADAWQAPDNPRWALAAQSYLYKLYVIREVPEQLGRMEDDPAAAFLRCAIPTLSQALAAR